MIFQSLLFTAAVAISGGSGASPFDTSGPWVRTPKDVEACSAQPILPWCSGGASDEHDMDLVAVRRVDSWIRNGFEYRLAPERPWRSMFSRAGRGGRWSGDCDELTFTMLDALAREGFPRSKMWRLVVQEVGRSDPTLRHMIGLIEVDGELFVVGDTSRPGVYPWAEALHRPEMVSRVDEGANWKRITSLPKT